MTTNGPQAEQPAGAGVRKLTAICLGLVVLVVWAFWPSVSNDFVNLDDPVYITSNPHVQAGLTMGNTGWAFRSVETGNWHPLTWLSYALDCQLYGLQPWGHHLTNLLLHIVNAVLVFLVFRRLTDATWRSALVAILFAVHPLHVESVAWASERKDTLSTLFWMLAMLFYVDYAQAKSRVESQESCSSSAGPASNPQPSTVNHCATFNYLLALFLFACGLMSKPMVVTLPVILLLVDWWPLRRFQPTALNSQTFTIWREKVPFFVVGILASILTLYSQREIGALSAMTIPDRLVNATLSYLRYPVQMIWPARLAPFYPLPQVFPFWPAAGVALVLLAASVLTLRVARARPYLAFGWVWYLVTLLPVIGLIQAGQQSHADRYTYVPLIGLFLLLVWAAHDFTKRWRYQVVCLSSAAVLVVSVCLVLTRRQIGYWKDSETLFRHALAVTRDNSVAHNNLGSALLKSGQVDEAIDHFQKALKLVPGFARPHYNLGIVLLGSGRGDEAIDQLQAALKLNPGFAQAHYSLGNALLQRGQLDEAMVHFQKALQLQPNLADARINLGNLLLQKGQADEAIAQFQKALEVRPNDPLARYNLGNAFLKSGRVDEAIIQLQSILEIRPDFQEACSKLGSALLQKGRTDEAMAQFQRAVQIDPKLANAQSDLGTLLVQRGRMDEAMEHYQRALELQPTNVSFLNNLAWVLATCPNPEVRNGARAVELAQKAERLGGAENSAIVGTLAAAYAEAGRFGEAVRTAERALNLATAQTNTAQIGLLRTNIALYAAGLPLRDTSQTNTFPNPNRP